MRPWVGGERGGHSTAMEGEQERDKGGSQRKDNFSKNGI